MPLYEYKCPNCGATEEHRLSFKDSNLIVCCTKCFVDGEVQEEMERQIGTLATWRWRGGYVPPGGMKHQDG